MEKLKWATVAFALGAVFLLGNSRLVTGKRSPIWDAWAFYGPEFTLVADQARAGHFLLWNPWVNGGTPDHADPTVGAASPVELFVGVIGGGSRSAFVGYWLFIWFLGPLGLILLGRHLGAPAWSAFIVALGYAFCSFYTGHAEHTSFVYSFSFLPWFVWRLDKALASRQLIPAFQCGALWGLSALGGYPQLTFLSGCFLCLWAVGRCCFGPLALPQRGDRGIRPPVGFAILALVLVFSVGTAVLAPSYVGLFTEGAGYTDRVGALPRDVAISSNEVDPGTLLTFASPYLHLLKYPGLNPTLWPNSDVSVMGNYIGALPLILALVAIVARPTCAWRIWLLAIVVVAMACAVGDHLPIRGWLYDLVPPTRYFRHSGAFRGYAIFGTAVLAMAGAKELRRALQGSLVQIGAILAIVSSVATIAAIVSYHHVISQVSHLADGLQRANRQLILVWVGASLIFLLTLVLPQAKKVFPVLLCLVALVDVYYTARISQPLVSDASFFGPLWSRTDANHKTDLTLPSLDRQLTPPSWLGSALNDANIPLRTATLFNDATMANHFLTDFSTHTTLSAMASGSNRIWFATETATVIPSDANYEDFVKRTDVLGAPVVVLHRPDEMVKRRQGETRTANVTNTDAISKLPAAQRVVAELITYTPNRLEFNVRCPSDGWLLVTDRWSRGWQATVNGLPVQIFGADFVFRAIPVRSGENKIQFSYHPFAWRELLLLSWSMLFIAFAGPYLARRVQGHVHRAT